MKNRKLSFHPMPLMLSIILTTASFAQAATEALHEAIAAQARAEYPSLFELYQHLHRHPELSLQEVETSARMAEELRAAGYEVTASVGGHGVVAVLRNGEGPVLMLRADMDALPVLEETGLPYASEAVAQDDHGVEVPVMHACGHDVHMTCLVGAARALHALRAEWRGTLLLVAQPAEERGAGAKALLEDGLFTRFPRPHHALALHVDPFSPAGSVGYVPGYAMANVDSVDITVRGVGGHGAYPHKTRDPIVLAAQIVLALQTIVSREVAPTDSAVVTVGSIHGGTKHNVIPNEVKLELTVRSYADETRAQILQAIERITAGIAQAAGLPPNRMPEVSVSDGTPAVYNTPELVERVMGVARALLGPEQVHEGQPVMGGEDFGRYGREEPRIPIFMFRLGSINPEQFAASQQQDAPPLPSLHSSRYAPDPERTILTGVKLLTAAAIDLLQ